MWQLGILLYALMPLYEQYLKESNAEEICQQTAVWPERSDLMASVLTFLEYYSFSGIGEGINTDLFTNCKCICLNAAD